MCLGVEVLSDSKFFHMSTLKCQYGTESRKRLRTTRGGGGGEFEYVCYRESVARCFIKKGQNTIQSLSLSQRNENMK